MYTLLLVTSIILSLSLVGLVLLQHGRGADAGAAFGSGASGTVFGSRGSATFLSHITSIVAALFFINCLALAWIIKHEPTDSGLISEHPIEEVVPISEPETSSPTESIPE